MQSSRQTNLCFAFAPVLVLGVNACASTHEPPAELLEARTAYNAAKDSDAWRYDQQGLNSASSALAKAESSFEKTGDSEATRKEAQVALARAQQAEMDGLAHARTQGGEKKAEVENSKGSARKAKVTLAVALFPNGQSRLPLEARDRLDQLVAEMKGHEDASIHIRGHADSTGSERKNMQLSRERADQVADYLSSRGIRTEQMVVDAVGDREPLATAKGADAINRRVQLVAYVPADEGQK